MASNSRYAETLRDPRWQRRRLDVMAREQFTCEGCGSTDKSLDVHHGYYEYGKQPWEYPLQSLHCLCTKCHTIAGEQYKASKRTIGSLDINQTQRTIGYATGLWLSGSAESIECGEDEPFLAGVGEAWHLPLPTIASVLRQNRCLSRKLLREEIDRIARETVDA